MKVIGLWFPFLILSLYYLGIWIILTSWKDWQTIHFSPIFITLLYKRNFFLMSTEFTMRVSRPLRGGGSFVGSLYSLSEKKKGTLYFWVSFLHPNSSRVIQGEKVTFAYMLYCAREHRNPPGAQRARFFSIFYNKHKRHLPLAAVKDINFIFHATGRPALSSRSGSCVF